MKSLLYISTAAMLFTVVGCNQNSLDLKSAQKDWQEEIGDIDKEVDILIEKDEQYRRKVNEEERQAILYMRDDWAKYSQKIQEIEKDHQFVLDLEKRILELKQRKQKILEEHQDKIPADQK